MDGWRRISFLVCGFPSFMILKFWCWIGTCRWNDALTRPPCKFLFTLLEQPPPLAQLFEQLYFQSDLTLLRSWYLSGINYSRTSEHWLKLQDKNKKVGLAELEADAEAKGLSREEGRKAFYRFRVFYIAVAEFFGLNGGDEWGVGHYLFKVKDLR